MFVRLGKCRSWIDDLSHRDNVKNFGIHRILTIQESVRIRQDHSMVVILQEEKQLSFSPLRK